MTTIRHATYIGPHQGWNIQAGMTALIMDGPNPETVLAQFDDFNAQRNGDDLAFGWHVFFKEHFRINDDPIKDVT